VTNGLHSSSRPTPRRIVSAWPICATATVLPSSLEVLDAQRSLFASQQALAQTRLALRQNQVLLFKALGGGWSLTADQSGLPGG